MALHASADGSVASFKSQMKKADGSGARFAIIVGSDEMAQAKISVKDMREGGEQMLLPVDEAAAHIRRASAPA